ncbi:MAG: FGGY-family carbohydrate kinase [Hydrogenophilaceae bacterium]|nr:FGGY-family carbohydrate kinase [Hydrogenophilaceae bacterium]
MRYALGLDFGTGGVRAMALAPTEEIEAAERIDFGDLSGADAAQVWRDSLFEVIAKLPQGVRKRLAAIAIDGTSASVLACDAELQALHPPLLYNDARATVEAARIREIAGPEHTAASTTSGLAKVLWLQAQPNIEAPRFFLNQADWLAALLSGRPGLSDYHNALKMGFDVEARRWPAWVGQLARLERMPRVVAPGSEIGPIERNQANKLGIASDCLIRAGTTDSIAAFLAAGVSRPGEAVTSLGTTLVLKLLSERRVEAARYGVYSHWFGDLWLAGGASNAGGSVLRQFFGDVELAALSPEIDPQADSGLDYYPLPRPGERFPVNDPALPPRLEPRPASDRQFLHGLLEGLARIEAQGYQRLAELGATPLTRVISAGGGARNPTYGRIRQRLLRVEVATAKQQEAAFGAGRLALHGTALFPLQSKP